MYLNGILADAITTTRTYWELYRKFVYSTIWTNTISFNRQDDANYLDIALCSIKFYYIPKPGIAYTSSYNSLKACNI